MTKKILLLVLALMLSVVLHAHDAEVNGIYYNIDSENKTAQVTFKGNTYQDYEGEYVGSVTIPSFVNYNDQDYTVVAVGDNAFGQNPITSVTIPSTITTISETAMAGCADLAEVVVSTENEYFASTDGVLFNKDKTKLILYPIAKEGTSYSIPDGVTALAIYSFYMTNLESVVMPNTVVEVERYAFYGAKKLTSIILGDGVELVGVCAFAACDALTSVILPASIATIEDAAFSECPAISTITCYAKQVPNISVFAFFSLPMDKVVLYVPCESMDAYKSHGVFGDFVNIECIEDTPTSVDAITEDVAISVVGGLIACSDDFVIYNMIGKNVTACNGSLPSGVYLVSARNTIKKVLVK